MPHRTTSVIAVAILSLFLFAYRSSAQEPSDRIVERARQGYLRDQLTLATIYRDGVGVTPDLSAAMYWFRRAANFGSPEAQLQLGALLLQVSSAKHDPAGALSWFRRSATSGYAPAMYDIGMVCLHLNLPRCEDGMAMISRSAELNYAPAETALGNAFIDGQYGLTSDPSKGIQWLKRAAKQKFPNAQYSLGLVYLTGTHVQPDLHVSVLWLKRAADQGFIPAEDVLGRMYLLGKGVPVDLKVAEGLLSAAAQNGNVLSFVPLALLHQQQGLLGETYFDLLCAQSSPLLAQKSFVRSTAEMLEAKLADQEKLSARMRADSWLKSHKDGHDPICNGVHRGTCIAPIETESWAAGSIGSAH